jgi:hypothetical protein
MCRLGNVRGGCSKPGRRQKSPITVRGVLDRGRANSINGGCKTYLKTQVGYHQLIG